MTNFKKSFALTFLLIALISFGLISPSSAAPNGVCNFSEFAGGDGSEQAPWLVENELDFIEVADCGGNLGWHYSQTANIVFTDTWRNAGYFSGNYDGNNYMIENIYIDGDNGFSGHGLFQALSYAYVEDLILKGVIDNAIYDTGLLAGSIYSSTVSRMNVYTEINLKESRGASYAFNVGGLAGSVRSDTSVGAVFVFPFESSEELSSTISGDYNVGGISGLAVDSSIYNSGATIDVEALGDGNNGGYAGGTVGYTYLSGSPEYENREFWNSYNYATGNVTCKNDARFCGGLVGASSYGTRNSFASGNVVGGSNVGGLVGSTQRGITESYATGNVEAAANYAGGLVGSSYLVSEETLFEKSYATGQVTGTSFVGGLFGSIAAANANSQILIENTYALGDMSGSSNVGNFVGQLTGDSSQYFSIRNSYSAGQNNKNTDGIVGNLSFTGPINTVQVFWNKGINGTTSSLVANAFAVPKSLFARQSTFSDPSWDLENVWKLDLDFQGGYLSLRGVGTFEAVSEEVPACEVVALAPITFKKGSIKFTNLTREKMRQNAVKIKNSYCSTVKIFGYSSKDEPKKKQKTLATQRARAVATFIRSKLQQDSVYLKVIAVGKGVLPKGSLVKNRKATSTIIN